MQNKLVINLNTISHNLSKFFTKIASEIDKMIGKSDEKTQG